METYKILCKNCGKITDVVCDLQSTENLSIPVYSDQYVIFDLSMTVLCYSCFYHANHIIIDHDLIPVITVLTNKNYKIKNTSIGVIEFESRRSISKHLLKIPHKYNWGIDEVENHAFKPKSYKLFYRQRYGTCSDERPIDFIDFANYLDERLKINGKRRKKRNKKNI